MRIAVVGMGVVGKHMADDIQRAGHIVVAYDVRPFEFWYNATREEVNTADAAFVCVSTPQATDGSCDTSAIDDVFSWLRVPVAIIRSTVPPGTTSKLNRQLIIASTDFPLDVAFCPEFIGEGINPPYVAMKQPPFVIIGGSPEAQQLAANVFAHLYNAECEQIFLDSTTAEWVKYMENYYLALKVSWANEGYDIAQKVGANFEQGMAALTHDYRIGRSHTAVYPEKRGFDGRCLPKDTSALLHVAGCETAPLLAAMIEINERRRK